MNEFDIILEECVDLIASGETTPEECLSVYPEYAAQLEPVLYTAALLQEGREVTPPPFLRARIRGELNRAMKNDPRKKNRTTVFFLAKNLKCGPGSVRACHDQYVFCPGCPAWGNSI